MEMSNSWWRVGVVYLVGVLSGTTPTQPHNWNHCGRPKKEHQTRFSMEKIIHLSLLSHVTFDKLLNG